MIFDITHALNSLRPGAEWSIKGSTYDGLDWLDKTQTKPTKKQVEAEISKLQSEYESAEYQRLRAPEYPDLKELADALYWSSKGDNTKLDEYYAKCEAVKLKYPKDL
jgi:hypothetical protein